MSATVYVPDAVNLCFIVSLVVVIHVDELPGEKFHFQEFTVAPDGMLTQQLNMVLSFKQTVSALKSKASGGFTWTVCVMLLWQPRLLVIISETG